MSSPVFWVAVVLAVSVGISVVNGRANDRVDEFFEDFYDWKTGQRQFVEVAKSDYEIRKAVT